jgi:hypothetical protein
LADEGGNELFGVSIGVKCKVVEGVGGDGALIVTIRVKEVDAILLMCACESFKVAGWGDVQIWVNWKGVDGDQIVCGWVEAGEG